MIRVTKALARKMGCKVPSEPRQPNRWEEMLAEQMELAGVPEPKRQYRFDPASRRTVDFAWLAGTYFHNGVWMSLYGEVALEVDGSVHRIKDKWQRDVDRHNWLELHGWSHLRVTPEMVRSGEALTLIQRFFKQCRT